MVHDTPFGAVRARACAIPADAPEADGTMARTFMVTAEVETRGRTGFGSVHGAGTAAALIVDERAGVPRGRDAMDVPMAWRVMQGAVGCMARSGVAATAIPAVDLAPWEPKRKLPGLPVATRLGRARHAVSICGSGGFTSDDHGALRRQLAGWVERDGCRWVKMKIGSDPARDPARVAGARAAIGDAVLFVGANGAFDPTRPDLSRSGTGVALKHQDAARFAAWRRPTATGLH